VSIEPIYGERNTVNIILLKHPESHQDILEPTAKVPSDPENGLTERGREQAQSVAEAVADIGGHVVVLCSPSLRCREAAEIIATSTGTDAEVSEELADRQMASMDDEGATIAEYRLRQEQVYLAPFDAAADEESAVSHRLRVESWLAARLAAREPDMTMVVVSHGAVIEHLQSALCWKPAGAMGATFTMCKPAHAHLWSAVEVPDGRLFWCLIGANLWLPARGESERQRETEDLATLTAQLSSAPGFEDLAHEAAQERVPADMTYYIR
jgi:broad specificity phosphatase PhoE